MKSEIFQNFAQGGASADEFAIDEETLEIFAAEAAELLTNIAGNLKTLEKSPSDAGALLEIRRGAHTLKGSAGIAGLAELARLAHRLEDLLALLAAGKILCDKRICQLLTAAVDCCAALARGENSPRVAENIARFYTDFEPMTARRVPPNENIPLAFNSENAPDFDKFVSAAITREATNEQNQAADLPNRTVVRVSLDKLDDLTKSANDLAVSEAICYERFAEFEKKLSGLQSSQPHESADALDSFKNDFKSLSEDRHRLIDKMNYNLSRLRQVSFGSISGRLRRTVNFICSEEKKSAELFLAGENLEIDTQTLDFLIEPLLHLLRNAVAHGIEMPEVRKSLGKPGTGKISVRLLSEKSGVTVIVSDDGCGISVTALKEKAIAEDFVSREKGEQMSDRAALGLVFLPGLTTAEKLNQSAGRGVGMNVVKNLIERRGGTITVASEMQRGTVFTLHLPVRSDAVKNFQTEVDEFPVVESSPGINKLLHSNESKSILIVDDSPSFRRKIINLIRNAEWQVSEANDGIEALAILNSVEKLPDIILTDAEMPRMDGYEFLAALRENKYLRRIPVIMTTSRTSEILRQKAFDAGVSEYLPKSCDDSTLARKIEMLAKSTW